MPRPNDPERDAAHARGAKRYIPTKPCRLGHFERYVVNGSCCACRRKERLQTQPMRAPVCPDVCEPRVKFTHSPEKRNVRTSEAAARHGFFKSLPAARALADYSTSSTARAHSFYLNRLIRQKAST